MMLPLPTLANSLHHIAEEERPDHLNKGFCVMETGFSLLPPQNSGIFFLKQSNSAQLLKFHL